MDAEEGEIWRETSIVSSRTVIVVEPVQYINHSLYFLLYLRLYFDLGLLNAGGHVGRELGAEAARSVGLLRAHLERNWMLLLQLSLFLLEPDERLLQLINQLHFLHDFSVKVLPSH